MMREKRLVNLRKNELRLGNFVVRKENADMVFMDLNGLTSLRLSRDTANGRMMAELWDMAQKEKSANAAQMLEMYSVTMMNVHCTMPFLKPQEDGWNYLVRLNELSNECVHRNAEFYGLKPDISDEEDAKIVSELKEEAEQMERLKNGEL